MNTCVCVCENVLCVLSVRGCVCEGVFCVYVE